MSEEKTYTIHEAQQFFARGINMEVWQLLERSDRSPLDDEVMIHAAHASLYHWLKVGTGVNHQRGEWLIARVYAELGNRDETLRPAQRCFELANEFPDQMKDFDRAYAHEALARANALSGNREEAEQHLRLANEAGQAIAGEKDKEIFMGDLNGGNWHGLR